MKNKFMIYGNCQCQALKSFLLKSPGFSTRFEQAGSIKPVHLLCQDDEKNLYPRLKNVDLFIYQDVKAAQSPLFITAEIISNLKQSCMKICIPNAYFRGYQPEITYMRSLGPKANGLMPYHDVNILREYVTDRDPGLRKSIEIIMDSESYSRTFIVENYNESMCELKRRELVCDIKISDFIETNWKDNLLFHSMNHPANMVLYEIAKRILNLIGIKEKFASPASAYLSLIILPIYRSVCAFIGAKFEDRVKIGNNYYWIQDYVRKTFEVYDKLPSDALKNCLADLCRDGRTILGRLAEGEMSHRHFRYPGRTPTAEGRTNWKASDSFKQCFRLR